MLPCSNSFGNLDRRRRIPVRTMSFLDINIWLTCTNELIVAVLLIFPMVPNALRSFGRELTCRRSSCELTLFFLRASILCLECRFTVGPDGATVTIAGFQAASSSPTSTPSSSTSHIKAIAASVSVVGALILVGLVSRCVSCSL